MKGMNVMENHELANIFPMLGAEELAELCADIKKNGLTEPITLYEGKVLDGRNRVTACTTLKIKPKTVEYTGNDPLAFVLSKNLHRRHLTTSQRAMIADDLANMRQGERTDMEPCRNSGKVNQSEAAKKLNVSRDSVQQAHKVRTKAVPEVAEAVESGKMPVSVAAKLADAPPEEQREAIARAERGEKHTSGKQPRRKTVAKEPEPEEKYIKVERRWEHEIEVMTEWWDTMPAAYRQLTGGDEIAGCMKIPIPFHHNVVLALFRQMCIDAGDDSEELRSLLIAEVNLLADRIEELEKIGRA
jgi:ParB-like chromosome segregation protein Spo0J